MSKFTLTIDLGKNGINTLADVAEALIDTAGAISQYEHGNPYAATDGSLFGHVWNAKGNRAGEWNLSAPRYVARETGMASGGVEIFDAQMERYITRCETQEDAEKIIYALNAAVTR